VVQATIASLAPRAGTGGLVRALATVSSTLIIGGELLLLSIIGNRGIREQAKQRQQGGKGFDSWT
jgi:hypothetical protein